MQNSVVLTLDIGTTSCKLVLIDKNGHELFSDKAHYPLLFPKPGQVEQDPQAIWSSIQTLLKRLSRDAGETYDIEAMAISSQISAHFLVDDAGTPLTNIISWMDSRAAAQARDLVSAYSKAQLRDALGMDMLIGPAFSIPKLKANTSRLETMPEAFVISGGASALDIWNQIKADIMGVPFKKLNTTEAGCLGVAILAAKALGWYRSLTVASENMIRTAKVYTPNSENHRLYNQKFTTYLRLYDALKPVFDVNVNQVEEVE